MIKSHRRGWIKYFIIPILFISAMGCSATTSILHDSEDDTALVLEQVEDETKESVEKMEEAPQKEIYIYVCGAVISPGVYKLEYGSRVFQAIECAGGFRDDAAVESVNQAELLEDQQQICIYTKKEMEELQIEQTKKTEETLTDGSVNINEADKAALMTLTGIGETRAEAIIAYRQKMGGFSTIEDLMKVEGIKEKIYEKLKDEITVD